MKKWLVAVGIVVVIIVICTLAYMVLHKSQPAQTQTSQSLQAVATGPAASTSPAGASSSAAPQSSVASAVAKTASQFTGTQDPTTQTQQSGVAAAASKLAGMFAKKQ